MYKRQVLKTGSLESTPVNDIIEPVFIPTLPAKLRLIAVAAVPTTFIWSEGEKPVNIRSYSTVSAQKSLAIAGEPVIVETS